jgi:hypothetical protein
MSSLIHRVMLKNAPAGPIPASYRGLFGLEGGKNVQKIRNALDAGGRAQCLELGPN